MELQLHWMMSSHTLWLCQNSYWSHGPVEIEDLPIEHGGSFQFVFWDCLPGRVYHGGFFAFGFDGSRKNKSHNRFHQQITMKWWHGNHEQTWGHLVGGLEHFWFFHILGIIISTDFHIFQRGWNHQPDYNDLTSWCPWNDGNWKKGNQPHT